MGTHRHRPEVDVARLVIEANLRLPVELNGRGASWDGSIVPWQRGGAWNSNSFSVARWTPPP